MGERDGARVGGASDRLMDGGGGKWDEPDGAGFCGGRGPMGEQDGAGGRGFLQLWGRRDLAMGQGITYGAAMGQK